MISINGKQLELERRYLEGVENLFYMMQADDSVEEELVERVRLYILGLREVCHALSYKTEW